MTNQARLQFTYGATTATASSNIASTIIQGPLTANKTLLESAYQADGALTYMVQLTNSGAGALTPVTLVGDLGTYEVSPGLNVTPLTYTGPAQLFLNGVYSASLTPALEPGKVTFTIPSLAPGVNAMLIYKARVNEYALLTAPSAITNTVSVDAPTMMDPVSVSHTVPVADYADVTITKSMTPNPITDGSTLTSTFLIQNFGNTAASSVVLTDAFTPSPDPITVTVDGVTLPGTDYDYTGGVLTLPNAGSAYSLTIPAASFIQDPATGEVTINPGSVTITVAGVI